MGKKYTQEEFIQKSKDKFGDKFDYSQVNYINSMSKVKLKCNVCGCEFEVVANSHLQRKGCPKCSGLRMWDTQRFIEEARKVHGDKYDYSKVNYVNKRTNVTIICPIHGEFSQNPHGHISGGNGCPECAKIIVSERKDVTYNPRKTKEQFQEDLNRMYGGKYEIVGEYINNKTHSEIFCHQKNQQGKEHGIFITRPDGLINGHGCPKCAATSSVGENELYEYIKSIYDGDVNKRDRIILKGKELDIYLPHKRLAFEFDGALWHSDRFHDKYDILEKTEICEKNGIQLIHVFDDEWNNKKDICKSRISGLLGVNNRIYGRKCILKEISYKEIESFLNENHIQGTVPSKVNIGLYYGDELVSAMSFGSLRKNLGQESKVGYYEMLRFCNKKYINVIGGASKMLKYFIEKYHPIKIISYADRRWSCGNLYEKIGFTKEKNTEQNYSYIKYNGGNRINRFSLRKDILVKDYGCPKDMTEKEFCESKGYFRVYDCGSIKYVWKNK